MYKDNLVNIIKLKKLTKELKLCIRLDYFEKKLRKKTTVRVNRGYNLSKILIKEMGYLMFFE